MVKAALWTVVSEFFCGYLFLFLLGKQTPRALELPAHRADCSLSEGQPAAWSGRFCDPAEICELLLSHPWPHWALVSAAEISQGCFIL